MIGFWFSKLKISKFIDRLDWFFDGGLLFEKNSTKEFSLSCVSHIVLFLYSLKLIDFFYTESGIVNFFGMLLLYNKFNMFLLMIVGCVAPLIFSGIWVSPR